MKTTMLASFQYDPLNRLMSVNPILKATHQRFYRNARLVTEIQGTVQRSYVHAADQLLAQHTHDSDTQHTSLFATDRQRSVLNTLNPNEIQSATYSPYGHHHAENNPSSQLGFNGERMDPTTGHYLLGNGYRAFNPVLMRFNSSDSMSPFGKGGINSYAYCLNNPMNLRDDNGHFPNFMIFKIASMMDPMSMSKFLDTHSPLKITSVSQPSHRIHTMDNQYVAGEYLIQRRYDSNNKLIYEKLAFYDGRSNTALITETGKPPRTLIGNTPLERARAGQVSEHSSLAHLAYSNIPGPQLNHPETLNFLKHIEDPSVVNQMNYKKALSSLNNKLTDANIWGGARRLEQAAFNLEVRAGKIRGIVINADVERLM